MQAYLLLLPQAAMVPAARMAGTPMENASTADVRGMEAADHECRSRQYGRRRQRRWPVPSVPVAPRPEEDPAGHRGVRRAPVSGAHGPIRLASTLVATSNRCQNSAPAMSPIGTTTSSTPWRGVQSMEITTDGIVHVTCQQADSQQGKHGGRRHYKNCGGAHSRAGLRRTCPRRLRAARDRRRALAAGHCCSAASRLPRGPSRLPASRPQCARRSCPRDPSCAATHSRMYRGAPISESRHPSPGPH